MTKRIKMVCPSCGSDDILFDAYATWDEKAQDFVLTQTFDLQYCNGCGDDGSQYADEVEIEGGVV